MLKYREQTEADNEAVAALVRDNLKQFGLDIPGTVYFDAGLDRLSDFYGNDERRYFVVEDKEECEVPEFILYDENGEVYVPQEVTADDIYARIDEITEKYNFANDWERDRVIGILLYRNSYYMSEEDINKIYKDYLANFGGINIMQQAGYEVDDFINNRSKIELKDYYIDERLSAEAEKIEIYIDNDADMTKYKDAFVEAMETVNNDGNDEKYYNPLCNIYESIKLDFTNDEKAIYNQYIDIADETVYYYVNNYDTLQYQISDYESSHIEKVKQLRIIV